MGPPFCGSRCAVLADIRFLSTVYLAPLSFSLSLSLYIILLCKVTSTFRLHECDLTLVLPLLLLLHHHHLLPLLLLLIFQMTLQDFEGANSTVDMWMRQ